MDTKAVIDYLNKTYGTKVGKCPESLFIFTDQKKSVNKDFMKYLRQCLNVEYKLNKDATYAEVKPSLDQLCKVLYNDYRSPIVTLMRIGMFAKGVVSDIDLNDTYDWDFGGYLSHTQDLLGIGSTDGFWAVETYALFNDTPVIYDEENGDQDILSMAHSLNSYLADHQDVLDKYNLQFVRTDGILENLDNYAPIITARLYNNLGLSCGFITDPKQEKPELLDLIGDNSENWRSPITQALFIRGCSADPDYQSYDNLNDDLGFFDNAYYQTDKQTDTTDHISKETVNFLISNKVLPNAVSVLKFKTELEKELRDKLNNNSFNLNYNDDEDNYYSNLKKLLGTVTPSIKLLDDLELSFSLYNGRNAKEKYGKHDDPVEGTFDQYVTDIKNGVAFKDTEQFGKRFKLKYTSVIPTYENLEKTITDPQLKLTTGLHLTDGKIKTQMSVSAVGKDMSITWLIYATKIHGKPLSMPYLLKIKLAFSNEDPINAAYESVQTVITNNLGTIDNAIVNLITDLHEVLNTISNTFSPYVDVVVKTTNIASQCAMYIVLLMFVWGVLKGTTGGLLTTFDTAINKSSNNIA